MNAYISKCCNAKATKSPLVATKDKKGGLGTWRCDRCGRKAIVTRVAQDEPKLPKVTITASSIPDDVPIRQFEAGEAI
jgi:hypothetical protein